MNPVIRALNLAALGQYHLARAVESFSIPDREAARAAFQAAKLCRDRATSWFEVVRRGKKAVVWLRNNIGLGQTADELLTAIGDSQQIELWVNSEGGCCLSGLEIAHRLKGRVEVATVQGNWKSAAVIATLCADYVQIHAGTAVMLHQPSASVYGHAQELRIRADELDRVSCRLRDLVAAKIGKGASQVEEFFLGPNDRNMTAQQAVFCHLADSIWTAPVVPSSESVHDGPGTGPDDSQDLFRLLRSFGPVAVPDRRRFAHDLAAWGLQNSI